VTVPFDHIAAAIAEEMEQCEGRVRALLDQSISLSEGEVLSAADNITDLNRDAQEHVVALDALRHQFDEERGSGGLSGALEKQRRTLGTYVQAMNQGLTEQHDAATRAIGCTNQITRLAREIEGISSALTVLTLNARIESSRSGQAGRVFATIADSMRALSFQVQAANGRVAELAASLKDIIPSIEQRARELREQNGALATDANTQLGELGSAYATARGAAAEVISGGGEHARRVVTRTHQVLSHLQYQDRMAQGLREIEAVVARAKCVTVGLLEALPPAHDAGDVARALEEARARAPAATLRLSGESELASGGFTVASGEVMLF
jgi:methyl-accepting chemotaxis protein